MAWFQILVDFVLQVCALSLVGDEHVRIFKYRLIPEIWPLIPSLCKTSKHHDKVMFEVDERKVHCKKKINIVYEKLADIKVFLDLVSALRLGK